MRSISLYRHLWTLHADRADRNVLVHYSGLSIVLLYLQAETDLARCPDDFGHYPFWTNFLVRTYALKQVLATEGLFNSFLMGLNLINQPLDLLFNEFAVIVGLLYGYLPFAVLPMYASIEKFDHSLMEAASDLGAPPWRAFLRVMLPMTLPGVIAALVLVFVPVVGAFITPDIMGGGKIEMIGTLINRQFGVSRNWPFGSAMSLVLMLMVLIGVIAYFRSSSEETRRAM
jgi:spermidine/putrescine transport system permease protein